MAAGDRDAGAREHAPQVEDIDLEDVVVANRIEAATNTIASGLAAESTKLDAQSAKLNDEGAALASVATAVQLLRAQLAASGTPQVVLDQLWSWWPYMTTSTSSRHGDLGSSRSARLVVDGVVGSRGGAGSRTGATWGDPSGTLPQ